jgi:hypothetical protein
MVKKPAAFIAISPPSHSPDNKSLRGCGTISDVAFTVMQVSASSGLFED